MKVVAKLVQLRCKNSNFFCDLQIFDEKSCFATRRGRRGAKVGKEKKILRGVCSPALSG